MKNLKWNRNLILAVIVGAIIGFAIGRTATARLKMPTDVAPLPPPTAFLDDANEVAQSFSRQWDMARDGHAEGATLGKARAAWRKSFAFEMRAVYRKHGREVPVWFAEE